MDFDFSDTFNWEEIDVGNKKCFLREMDGQECLIAQETIHQIISCDDLLVTQKDLHIKSLFIALGLFDENKERIFNIENEEDFHEISTMPNKVITEIFHKACVLSGFDHLLPEQERIKKKG